MTEQEMAARLRNVVQAAKGDDLERANAAFQGLDDARLDSQYGQSGLTRRQIWDDYKRRRQEDEQLVAFTETLLASRGL